MWIYSYLKINYLYSFSYSCINNFDCIAGCVMKSKAWREAAFLWISGFLITLRLASNFPCSYSNLGFCHKQSQKLCKILAEQTLVLLVCFFSGCLKSFPDCNMMSIGRDSVFISELQHWLVAYSLKEVLETKLCALLCHLGLHHANGYDFSISAEKRLMLCVLAREQVLWGKQPCAEV